MPEKAQQKTHNSLLKQTREAKGLTLDIVHEATKIPLDALKAIEEGYSVRILTPFYYRGFLKIYAEFLGLDPAEVLSHYQVQKPKPVIPKPARNYQPKRNEAVESAMESTGEFFKKISGPKGRRFLVRLVGIALVIFAIVKIGGCAVAAFSAKGRSASGGKSVASAKLTPAAKKAKKVKPYPVEPALKPAHAPVPQPVPAAADKPQAIQAESKGSRVTLAVRAVKDTWVQTKTDGEIVFQMTMKKGTMESWEAKDQIELAGRNVSELDMEVNGKHIGSLGSAERAAKRVLITKEGLTVKK